MLSSLIEKLAPFAYIEVRERAGLHQYADLSHSNRCDLLTLVMSEALTSFGQPFRRELHATESGLWHFVLVHATPDSKPTADDVITDMNPWQFTSGRSLTGYLEGSRCEVMDRLSAEGADEEYVSLRSVASVKLAHTLIANPHQLPKN